MAIVRTNESINMAEPSAQGAGKSVPPMGCSESSQRRWQVISHFVLGSARRPCATEVQQHFSNITTTGYVVGFHGAVGGYGR